MYIFLILFITPIVSYSMQLYNPTNTLPLCSMTERKFIDFYLQNTFNISKPLSFTIKRVCAIYQSKHLVKNINSIVQSFQGQASEKVFVPDCLNTLKMSENAFLYTAFLEYSAQFFPKIIKVIQCHCTLPLSVAVQKRFLRRFWYAYWTLLLPTKVERLYEKGISVSSIIGQQKELLKNFKSECLLRKKPYVLKDLYTFEKKISCYMLCMIFSEKFFLIADEIRNQRHRRIVNQSKMELRCKMAANIFQEVLEIMKPLKPWVIISKEIKLQSEAKLEIMNMIIEFWGNFWKSPHGKPNYKKNITMQLKNDVQKIVDQYQNDHVATFIL